MSIRMSTSAIARSLLSGAVASVLVWSVNAAGLPDTLSMTTLSSRPDLVSGGDALIEVKAGVPINHVVLTLNGKDVSSQISLDPATGSYRGMVSGMIVGQNRLVAHVKAPFKG